MPAGVGAAPPLRVITQPDVRRLGRSWWADRFCVSLGRAGCGAVGLVLGALRSTSLGLTRSRWCSHVRAWTTHVVRGCFTARSRSRVSGRRLPSTEPRRLRTVACGLAVAPARCGSVDRPDGWQAEAQLRASLLPHTLLRRGTRVPPLRGGARKCLGEPVRPGGRRLLLVPAVSPNGKGSPGSPSGSPAPCRTRRGRSSSNGSRHGARPRGAVRGS